MQVVPISNKMVTGNASAADGGERCFVHLGQLVRAWIRARVLERVLVRAWVLVRMLERVRERGHGVSCGAGHSADAGCERVAERERELEAQVRLVVTRAGPASIAARVRVVVAVRMVVAIRERGCCAVFCGFFSTIQSKIENKLSFFNQKAYSDIRLIDYSVGFCNAQFLCDCASRCCTAISARERITLLPHDAKTKLLRGCASRCCNNASCTPGNTRRSRNFPLN